MTQYDFSSALRDLDAKREWQFQPGDLDRINDALVRYYEDSAPEQTERFRSHRNQSRRELERAQKAIQEVVDAMAAVYRNPYLSYDFFDQYNAAMRQQNACPEVRTDGLSEMQDQLKTVAEALTKVDPDKNKVAKLVSFKRGGQEDPYIQYLIDRLLPLVTPIAQRSSANPKATPPASEVSSLLSEVLKAAGISLSDKAIANRISASR